MFLIQSLLCLLKVAPLTPALPVKFIIQNVFFVSPAHPNKPCPQEQGVCVQIAAAAVNSRCEWLRQWKLLQLQVSICLFVCLFVCLYAYQH